MSPRIAAAFQVILPRSAEPIDRVLAAVGAVKLEGVRLVRHGECRAVELHAITAGWVVDRRHPVVVDLLGALLLALQPEGPDAVAGLAAVLDVSPDWLAGLFDGWNGERDATLLAGPSRLLYRDGLRAGRRLVALLPA
jgi:hypothetical protein